MKMKESMKINDLRIKLQEYKDLHDLTIADLAKKFGTSHITIDKFLYKNSLPQQKTLRKIYKFFGLDPDCATFEVAELRKQLKDFIQEQQPSVNWLVKKTGLSHRAINAVLQSNNQMRGSTVTAIQTFLNKKPKVTAKEQKLIKSQRVALGLKLQQQPIRMWRANLGWIFGVLIICFFICWNIYLYYVIINRRY